MDRLQLPSRPIARGIKNTYHARLRCSARADNSLDAAKSVTLACFGPCGVPAHIRMSRQAGFKTWGFHIS